MKTGWAIALGFLIGLLGTGAILLASSPPRGEPITLLPPPTPIPIQVYVSGAINQPGVYALPAESRLQDALSAAGGPSEGGDIHNLNLAALLQDGSQVRVPSQSQSDPAEEVTGDSQENPASATADPDSGIEFPININTATQAELEALPGIGPVTAGKIITYRQENGAFTLIEEIQKVSGIGPATFAKIKDLITVDETQ